MIHRRLGASPPPHVESIPSSEVWFGESVTNGLGFQHPPTKALYGLVQSANFRVRNSIQVVKRGMDVESKFQTSMSRFHLLCTYPAAPCQSWCIRSSPPTSSFHSLFSGSQLNFLIYFLSALLITFHFRNKNIVRFPKVIMVHFSRLLAGLAIVLTASTAPLTVPLGTSGESLTISEDGRTINIGGQTINTNQVRSISKGCSSEGKGSGQKGHGSGKGSSSGAATNAKAIYFMTNAANNSIVALKVAADGTLSDGSITATGGAGMNGVDSNGAPAAPDALFSQGAVKVVGSVSFALLGSAMFRADRNRAWLPSTPVQIQSPCSISTPRIQQNSHWSANQQIRSENSQ